MADKTAKESVIESLKKQTKRLATELAEKNKQLREASGASLRHLSQVQQLSTSLEDMRKERDEARRLRDEAEAFSNCLQQQLNEASNKSYPELEQEIERLSKRLSDGILSRDVLYDRIRRLERIITDQKKQINSSANEGVASDG